MEFRDAPRGQFQRAALGARDRSERGCEFGRSDAQRREREPDAVELACIAD